MGSDGISLRINVDDGKATVDGSHKYKDGDANAGKTPEVVAGAYTNSFKGTKATTLYNIDAATGALVTQAPPNDGVLNTVGSLGMAVSGPVAFNIVSTGEDKNAAWLVAGGSLYSVDLKTGKATMAGKIEGLNGPQRHRLDRLSVIPASGSALRAGPESRNRSNHEAGCGNDRCHIAGAVVTGSPLARRRRRGVGMRRRP